jgi:hypothetical protein
VIPLLFVLLVAVFPVRVEAEEVCASFFAAQSQRFPVQKAMRVFNGVKRPCASILLDSFGVSNRFFRAFRALPQPVKVLQVHVTNQSCVRLGRCQPGEAARTPEQVRHRAKRAARLCERFGFECFGTPGLEDGWSNKKARAMTCAMKEVFSYAIFRNPLGREARAFTSACADGVELHDLNSEFDRRPCIFNNDGFDVDFRSGRRPLRGAITPADLFGAVKRARDNHCHISIWWNNQGARDGRFIPPRHRSFKLFGGDILTVNYILRSLQNEKDSRCAQSGVRCLSTKFNARR